MKKTKFIIAAIVALALIAATAAVGAASYEPGSSEDPIVTKSYVDSQIEALKKSGGSTVVFEPVSVAEGKSLIGGTGTELILRSGGALAIAKGQDGIPDVTKV